MSNNLRSILGISRVQKKKKNNPPAAARTNPSSASSSWTSSLPRTKLTTADVGPSSKASRSKDDADDVAHDYPYHDDGLVVQGAPHDLDVAQAHASIRARMFDPVPDRGSGMNSTKIATVLQTRAVMPPVVSTAHIQAVLGKNPTAAEREVVELVRSGLVRRIVMPQRKNGKVVGDLLVFSRELEDMVRRSEGKGLLDGRAGERFVAWLRGNPTVQVMGMGMAEGGFESEQVDALVRAGFLTAVNDGAGRLTGVYARPEDRSSMLSLEAVSRAAAGSMAAVGGENALHSAGGTGGARSADGDGGAGPTGCFSVAVPGTGLFLKIVSAALERLEELLERTQYREMSKEDLREKWDGGIAGDREAALAKKARGEFVGILPGRTRKWRDFSGLAFDWILQEAVGVGLVEMFETHSVGRGVRLLV